MRWFRHQGEVRKIESRSLGNIKEVKRISKITKRLEMESDMKDLNLHFEIVENQNGWRRIIHVEGHWK